jgi:hypothetical protein
MSDPAIASKYSHQRNRRKSTDQDAAGPCPVPGCPNMMSRTSQAKYGMCAACDVVRRVDQIPDPLMAGNGGVL